MPHNDEKKKKRTTQSAGVTKPLTDTARGVKSIYESGGGGAQGTGRVIGQSFRDFGKVMSEGVGDVMSGYQEHIGQPFAEGVSGFVRGLAGQNAPLPGRGEASKVREAGGFDAGAPPVPHHGAGEAARVREAGGFNVVAPTPERAVQDKGMRAGGQSPEVAVEGPPSGGVVSPFQGAPGTVSTIPAGVDPFAGPNAALRDARREEGLNPEGTGFSQEVLNDQMLRAEGNAHLASDATPADKRRARLQEIDRELANINLGGDQTIGELAANRLRYSQLLNEKKQVRAEGAAAGEAATATADREAELEKERIEQRGETQRAEIEAESGGDLKVGGTEESILRKVAQEGGLENLNPGERYILLGELRQQAIEDLGEVMLPDEITEADIQQRIQLYMGAMSNPKGTPPPDNAANGQDYSNLWSAG